jgi:DNA polymerase sigma
MLFSQYIWSTKVDPTLAPPSGSLLLIPTYHHRTDHLTLLSSALSREAIGFVKRIDSKLQEQAFVQQLALSKLQEVATSIWSDSTIGIYGSSFTRLALPHSDIDCVLTSPSASDKQPAVLLKKLEIELRRLSWARRVELLGNAKIPVLKIVFCQSSMSTSEVMLDLTCSHSPGHSGLNARELIYSFQVEMPALRPLVLILKSHIQRRGTVYWVRLLVLSRTNDFDYSVTIGLNSAYTGGLSSYGLVLLAVRFLQVS